MALAIFTIAACNTTQITARGHNTVNTNAYTQLATNLSTATTDMQKALAWKNFRITSAQEDHLSTNEILHQTIQLHDKKTLSDEQFTRILGAFKELYRLHKNSKGDWYFDENGTQTKLS
jgi:hypothetical protein